MQIGNQLRDCRRSWQTLFQAPVGLVFLIGLATLGCGDSPEKQNQASSKNSKSTDPSGGAKMEKVVSKLPFKEVDFAKIGEGVEPGKRLPNVTGTDAQGQKFALADYKGKVILLDTWASW